MAYRISWTLEQREAFRKRWLKFRERYGLTQEAMAEAMGVHVNTVSRVERGKFVPQNETVRRFGEVEKRFKEGEKRERRLVWVPGEAGEL